MQSHTTIGARLLAESTSEVIECAGIIALSHHERWDGGGYPRGLEADDIPVEGRIVAVVDALDALTHDRPYQAKISYDAAEARLRADAGTAFAPDLAEALVHARTRLRVVMSEGA